MESVTVTKASREKTVEKGLVQRTAMIMGIATMECVSAINTTLENYATKKLVFKNAITTESVLPTEPVCVKLDGAEKHVKNRLVPPSMD